MGVRFAPSPTGRFHLGNLRTAWVSKWWSRKLHLPWVVRFEDIDQPRSVPGAMEAQLKDMAYLRLKDPDRIEIQSQHHHRHWELFARAVGSGQVYPCFCSRKEIHDAIQQSASAPHVEPPVYSGKCRTLTEFPMTPHPTVGWRFRMPKGSGEDDFVIGRSQIVTSPREVPSEPSFVPAYHWACAVDDYDGDYALLVRAWDLAHAAESQRAIHRWISSIEKPKPVPAIFHTSLVVVESGKRLEKRTPDSTLAEMLEKGMRPLEIRGKFLRSFTPERLKFAPEDLFGETKRTITLEEMGF